MCAILRSIREREHRENYLSRANLSLRKEISVVRLSRNLLPVMRESGAMHLQRLRAHVESIYINSSSLLSFFFHHNQNTSDEYARDLSNNAARVMLRNYGCCWARGMFFLLREHKHRLLLYTCHTHMRACICV